MPQAADPAARTGGGWGISPSLQAVLQGALLFIGGQLVLQQFMKSGSSPTTNSIIVPSFDARPLEMAAGAMFNPIPQTVSPIWPTDTALDLKIYVSPSLSMPRLRDAPEGSLVLDETMFRIGDWKDKREISTSFAVPESVQNNGTLWAHFYAGISGSILDPREDGYDTSKAYSFVRPLTQYLAKKKIAKTKKLLGKAEAFMDLSVDELTKRGKTIASYYHPNFTISVIPDSGVLNYPNSPPAVQQFVFPEVTHARDTTGQHGWYYPVLFHNTFWQLRDHMTELNSTVERLPLHISLNNLNNWKFSIIASIDEGMKSNQRQIAAGGALPAGGDGSEFEMFKGILLDTNVYLLATTAIVSMLHMIFEMLAFKSDISHWRNKKDNVGVSVRTILANVFMQLIIFLYLMDNSDGTSYMILVGQAFGILLEAWKITKTVDVRIRPAAPGSWLPYHITFEDKHKLSETEQKTKEYDEIAFRYMYLLAIPLLGAYAIYSLLYDTHKSWYSFCITTLVGSVYAYGFLMMVPSLYINYRLKSVAHMPAKAMTYKFLNTFIDDLFAFTIKMPTLHRLATLRDDVIFFIYLYQGWKYKVDYTRVNEFGQGGDDEKEEVDAKLAGKPSAGSITDADLTGLAVVKEVVEKPVVESQQGVTVGSGGSGTAKGARKRK